MYTKLAFLAASALFFAATAPAQTQSNVNPSANRNPPEETCAISGTVIGRLDSAPLKGATVQLTSEEDQDDKIATKTGADGRFELRNIPAGQYRLIVHPPGNDTGSDELEQEIRYPRWPGRSLNIAPGSPGLRWPYSWLAYPLRVTTKTESPWRTWLSRP